MSWVEAWRQILGDDPVDRTSREVSVQDVLAELIVGRRPLWFEKCETTAGGHIFISRLWEMALGSAPEGRLEWFVSEYALPVPPEWREEIGLTYGCPDFACRWGSSVLIVELKTETGSYRARQMPDYSRLARRLHPDDLIDLLLLGPSLPGQQPACDDRQRYVELTWADIPELITRRVRRAGARGETRRVHQRFSPDSPDRRYHGSRDDSVHARTVAALPRPNTVRRRPRPPDGPLRCPGATKRCHRARDRHPPAIRPHCSQGANRGQECTRTRGLFRAGVGLALETVEPRSPHHTSGSRVGTGTSSRTSAGDTSSNYLMGDNRGPRPRVRGNEVEWCLWLILDQADAACLHDTRQMCRILCASADAAAVVRRDGYGPAGPVSCPGSSRRSGCWSLGQGEGDPTAVQRRIHIEHPETGPFDQAIAADRGPAYRDLPARQGPQRPGPTGRSSMLTSVKANRPPRRRTRDTSARAAVLSAQWWKEIVVITASKQWSRCGRASAVPRSIHRCGRKRRAAWTMPADLSRPTRATDGTMTPTRSNSRPVPQPRSKITLDPASRGASVATTDRWTGPKSNDCVKERSYRLAQRSKCRSSLVRRSTPGRAHPPILSVR